MILYRGDNINNRLTNPKIYRYDGIRSKAFGKGDPAYIQRIGLTETIRQHIKPETKNDKEFYDKTDFISFSRNIERSMFWLKEKDTVDVVECNVNYEETRYLFLMDIPENELIEFGQGIYSFKFKCNPKLKRANSNDIIFNSALTLTHGYNECKICNISEPSHEIILINTIRYLEHNIKGEKFAGALNFASVDEEWLVLPFDSIEMNESIKCSRIPRAEFWTVKHYKEK
jgi:hypothetical protein